MQNLQTAIDDIEVRAAEFPRNDEVARSCEEPYASKTPTSNDAADPITSSDPITYSDRITLAEPDVDRIESQRRSIEMEPTEPYQAAACKVLKQLGNHTESSLLLLSETPPPADHLRDSWGHAIAKLIDEPVLMIELAPASASEPNAASASATEDNFPAIIQSEHPGLCTLTTAWHTLKGKQAARWWSEAWESFGVILLDGSGLDLTIIESILPRCTHVVFLVEYESTSRSWAKHIRRLIATHPTRSIGCIATVSPHAA